MSAHPSVISNATRTSAAEVLVRALLDSGITCGFGIPSIHNIAIYDALRRQPAFHHWIVRHEQAAGYAADGFCRRSGHTAAIFASTGPGNLFTLVPLLESLQTHTPVLLIGTNVASPLLGKSVAALHETPQQLDIFKPLTRFAVRIGSPDEIPSAVAAAARARGPAFIEIPHDLLLSPPSGVETSKVQQVPSEAAPPDLADALAHIEQSRKPVVILGSGISTAPELAAVQKLAETLAAPVLTTTSGKGQIADDHPLAMGCISRLGVVQELLLQSDLLISIGARLTEFDTGRFTLKLPARHIQVDSEPGPPGLFPVTCRINGDVAHAVSGLCSAIKPRSAWWDTAGSNKQEKQKLELLQSDSYAALMLLRGALDRDDVVVNDQSILNYWASAFFPVLGPRTFLYPTGSGTLGYGLPAAIGAACALRDQGVSRRVVCIAGDGGFQYTSHELATLAQYGLPVKVLLVNDNAYGIIGFLQRSLFGHTHEIGLRNPDFCALAGAYGIRAFPATDFESLRRQFPLWLNSDGPALLEWRTELKAPWEVGAIIRPANLGMKEQGMRQS